MDLISAFGANLGQAVTVALSFLVALTIVVFVHEYGHFQVARWCGVAVKTFSIGFGSELYGWNDRHGTRWRIAAIPLGGYVQFIDDSNPASAGAKDDKSEALSASPELMDDQRQGAFHSMPVWKRSAVVAAGPIANFLLAIAIFAATFLIAGYPVIDTTVAQVTPGSPAESAGFKPGDKVVAINGNEIEGFSDLQTTVGSNVGRELTFGIVRDGAKMTLKATPMLREVDDPISGKIKRPIIGISVSAAPKIADVKQGSIAEAAGFRADDLIVAVNGQPIEFFSEVRDALMANGGKETSFKIKRNDGEVTLRATPPVVPDEKASNPTTPRPSFGLSARNGRLETVGPIEAVARGVERTGAIIVGTLSYLGDVFTGRQGSEQIGGIVRIADAAGKVAAIDWRMLISFVAFISVSIGLINLFPVPVLDGGHLVFYAIEAIRGQPVSEEVQEYAFRMGFALILMLLIFTLYNDRFILVRWLTWSS